MISLKKLLYKMVEAINANHLPAATTTDKGMVLGIKNDGTYGLIPQTGGGGGWETVVLTGTIEHVASRKGTGSRTYSTAELASLGISNFDEWTLVSVKQTDLVSGGYRYGAMYNTDLSGMVTYGNSYPLVTTSSNSTYFLTINVLNTRETEGEYDDIDYEVVLARKTAITAHNFRVLNFTVSDVPAEGHKLYTFTDEMLAEEGIDNMFSYEVVGISAKPTDRNSMVYNAHYASSSFVSPAVTYSRTGEEGVTQGLQVDVYNVYSSVKSYDVRMILMRVGSGLGGSLNIQKYTGTIGTIEANSFGYLNVPFSELGITDPDSVTILSVEYFIEEIRANNPASENPVGYSIRRDMDSNGYVRLICRNNNNYGVANVRVQIRYIVEAE